MNYQPSTRQIAFVLPEYFRKAEVVFQKLGESFSQVTVKIKPGNRVRHTVSTKDLSQGFWKVYLNWTEGNQQYYREDLIEVG